MRLHIVHDATGRIVAAAVVPEGDDDAVTVTPLAGPRQHEADVDVPDDMAGEDLDVICTRTRLDTGANRLVRYDAGT